MNDHAMLDDVALYALGTLPATDAARVRAHLAECAECRDEYALLAPTAAVVGLAGESTIDMHQCAGTRLKPAIMARVRREAVAPLRRSARGARPPLWPAYLVAAACLVLALISGVANLVLVGQNREMKVALGRMTSHSTALARNLADERTTIADLMSPDAQRYPATDGDVVTRGKRLYVALHDLPEPPRGKVYQAWTLPKGGTTMRPSVTFVPDARGVAVIALPVDARRIAAVALSIEPEGGSKAPTSKPVFVVTLS